MNQEVEIQPFFEQVASAACQELFSRYGVMVRRADDTDQPVSPDFLLCSSVSRGETSAGRWSWP
jgi:hypothetical protein